MSTLLKFTVVGLQCLSMARALPADALIANRAFVAVNPNPTGDAGSDSDFTAQELAAVQNPNIYTNPPTVPDQGKGYTHDKQATANPLVPVVSDVGNRNTAKSKRVTQGDQGPAITYHTSSTSLKAARQGIAWFPDIAPTATLLTFFQYVSNQAEQAYARQANATGTDGAVQYYTIQQGDLSFFMAIDTAVMNAHQLTFCWADIKDLAGYLRDDSVGDGDSQYGWSFYVKGNDANVIYGDGHIGYSFVPDKQATGSPYAGKRLLDNSADSGPNSAPYDKRDSATGHTLAKRTLNFGLNGGWHAILRFNRNAGKLSQQFLFLLMTHAVNQINEGLPSGREVNEFIAQVPQYAAAGVQNAANYAFHIATDDPTQTIPINVINEIVAGILTLADAQKWSTSAGDRYMLQGDIKSNDGVRATWSLGPKLQVGWQTGVQFTNPDGSTVYGAFVHP